MGNLCPQRRDAAYLDPLCREVEGDAEVVERARDLAQRRPRRDEARESHVAGRAAHGLKVDVGQGARRRTRPRSFALLLSPVGDLTRRHEGGGEDDGEHYQRPRVAPDGVGDGGRVPLPAGLADGVGLAPRRVDQAPPRAGDVPLYAVPELHADLLADDLWVDVLAKVPHVPGHARPDLEHLSLYALRCLAHDLNCPFTQLMFCWRARIVRCGTGSILRSMLAPVPASIPPIRSSTPETMSAESHSERKRLSTYTPVREMKMRKTSMNTAPMARRPAAMPACRATGTSSVFASSSCLSASS